jgi:hypothetical protein
VADPDPAVRADGREAASGQDDSALVNELRLWCRAAAFGAFFKEGETGMRCGPRRPMPQLPPQL